jgi:hypothetical protein
MITSSLSYKPQSSSSSSYRNRITSLKSNDKVEVKESTRQKLSDKSKGSSNPSAKLTEKEVLEIKRLLRSKLYTHYQIADMFKISRPTVGFIKNERLWAHVKLEDED